MIAAHALLMAALTSARARQAQPGGALCSMLPSALNAAALEREEGLSRGALNDEQLTLLSSFRACQTAAAGDDRCASLERLGGRAPYFAERCRRRGALAAVVAGAFRGGDVSRSCRRYASAVGLSLGTKLDPLCRRAARAIVQGRSPCAYFASEGIVTAKGAKSCAAAFLFVTGRPDDCGAENTRLDLEECRAMAALVAGLRRGGATCADSPDCAAVSQGPKACEKIESQAVASVLEQCEQRPDSADMVTRRAAEEERDRAKEQARGRAAALLRQKTEAAAQKPRFKKREPMKSTQDLDRELLEKVLKLERQKSAAPSPGPQQAPQGVSP